MTNIAVIGNGAVGSVIAHELKSAGKNVRLFGRQEQQIILSMPQQVKLNVTSLVVNQEKFDYIFVAVKATRITEIRSALIKMCHPNTVIIICQNGIGQLSQFNMAQSFQAAVYISGQKNGLQVTHFRDKKLILPEHHLMHQLKEELSDTELVVEISSNQLTILWYKMLVNLGINTVTALSKNTVQIVEIPELRELVQTLLKEGILIANTHSESFTHEVVNEIMAIYDGYPSNMGTSMYYDMLENRLLEYDFIQGEFYRLARHYHLTTPVLDTCCTLLSAYQYKKH